MKIWIFGVHVCTLKCFLVFISGVTGDRVGLAITQSLTLTGLLQWGVRQRKYPTMFFQSKLNTKKYSHYLEFA